ncbi:MAG: serine/threonine protein kinase [Proteobacteria bacterium]|nr:serine/threonine protein kinase [Pseudomonadota bacterium]
MAPLGRGGMAEVDQRLNRPVARKMLQAELNQQAVARRRFRREIEVQTRLDHPAIVPVFDRGTTPDGREFFTMRRIGGETLGSAIEKISALVDPEDSKRERRRLLGSFQRVCLAVDYAHAAGVIHRDLKPDNVMLGRFGEVYVLDWGIAHVDAASWETQDLESSGEPGAPTTSRPPRLTVARGVLGTPAYMSPDQSADPTAVTSASDVYSLGAVLFFLLTAPPLRSGSELAWPIDAELEPTRRNPALAPEYDANCRRACALEPAERYPSARGLHDAIEAVERGDHAGALQQAGRALSLDPTNTEASTWLTLQMLAPRDEDPVALLDERDAADSADGKRMLRTNALITLLILGVAGVLLTQIEILRVDLPAATLLPSRPGRRRPRAQRPRGDEDMALHRALVGGGPVLLDADRGLGHRRGPLGPPTRDHGGRLHRRGLHRRDRLATPAGHRFSACDAGDDLHRLPDRRARARGGRDPEPPPDHPDDVRGGRRPAGRRAGRPVLRLDPRFDRGCLAQHGRPRGEPDAAAPLPLETAPDHLRPLDSRPGHTELKTAG